MLNIDSFVLMYLCGTRELRRPRLCGTQGLEVPTWFTNTVRHSNYGNVVCPSTEYWLVTLAKWGVDDITGRNTRNARNTRKGSQHPQMDLSTDDMVPGQLMIFRSTNSQKVKYIYRIRAFIPIDR